MRTAKSDLAFEVCTATCFTKIRIPEVLNSPPIFPLAATPVASGLTGFGDLTTALYTGIRRIINCHEEASDTRLHLPHKFLLS